MALHDVRVPLYNSSGEDEEHEMIIDEFAGRIEITIRKDCCNLELSVSCSFEDLQRAWNAVKRH